VPVERQRAIALLRCKNEKAEAGIAGFGFFVLRRVETVC
jgi:hypothetical protein